MRRATAAAVLFLAVMIVGPVGARADLAPQPGSVAIGDKLGRRDVVTFYSHLEPRGRPSWSAIPRRGPACRCGRWSSTTRRTTGCATSASAPRSVDEPGCSPARSPPARCKRSTCSIWPRPAGPPSRRPRRRGRTRGPRGRVRPEVRRPDVRRRHLPGPDVLAGADPGRDRRNSARPRHAAVGGGSGGDQVAGHRCAHAACRHHGRDGRHRGGRVPRCAPR